MPPKKGGVFYEFVSRFLPIAVLYCFIVTENLRIGEAMMQLLQIFVLCS